MMKNKLNRYFIKEIFKSYFLVLVSLSSLFLVLQAAKYLYLVTDNGLSLNSYAKYIFFLIPKIISQLMIISFLISMFLNLIKFQSNKELEIFWLAGISKIKIVQLVIKFSIFLTFFCFLFYIYLTPESSFKSRQIISNSEFSFINSLVKKNNFNSLFNDLTLFVHKNDQKGNLEKIYIFEKNKTIISKKGRILNINDKNFLELIDGVIHEKNLNNKITTVKFEKTLYDFTKYNPNIINTPKVQERDLFWILNDYKKNQNSETLYEIHKRLIKPLIIPIIGVLCCFGFYSNEEKININKIKIVTFLTGTLLIILIEILLNLSTVSYYFKYFLYLFPILIFYIFYFYLIKFLSSEASKS